MTTLLRRCASSSARLAIWAGVVLLLVGQSVRFSLVPIDLDQSTGATLALLHGHLAGVYRTPTSLTSPPGFILLSLPLDALCGGHPTSPTTFRVVGLASLAFLAFAALRLAAVLHPRAAITRHPFLVLALGLSLPVGSSILNYFHPEDLVATAFALLCLKATIEGRSITTGLMLGSALLTRQWALLVVVPVLLYPGTNRRRVVGGATLLCLIVLGPFAVVNLPGLRQALTAPVTTLSAYSVWRYFAFTRLHVYAISRLAPLACCVPTAIVLRRGWGRHPPTPQQLISSCAALLATRALFDTAALVYYLAPATTLLLILGFYGDGRRSRIKSLGTFAFVNLVLASEPHLRNGWGEASNLSIAILLLISSLLVILVGVTARTKVSPLFCEERLADDSLILRTGLRR